MSANAVTGKRKRPHVGKNVQCKKAATQAAVNGAGKQKKESQPEQSPKPSPDVAPKEAVGDRAPNESNDAELSDDVHLQIVAGSYERVLHGIHAAFPRSLLSKPQNSNPAPNGPSISFTDTFLFAAHASSIRCLAISPPSGPHKRLLATGSTDERINLYSLSTTPSPSTTITPTPTAPTTSTTNRPLGTLLHHSRPLTSLTFPAKTTLFSSAEDSTLGITRTRDWTTLHTIKSPIPTPQGRPSGDTAAPGEVPSGINSFAVHPSQKLMLSVGRGERCMRLWNLITGKKAGVLSFSREMLAQVGEGRFGTGEGRQVLFDAAGEVFVVGFERGGIVFGLDSKARAVVKVEGRQAKVQQMRFLPERLGRVLAVSTEDGHVMFFDLAGLGEEVETGDLPVCSCVGQMGGRAAGVAGRVKDFEILEPGPAVAGEEAPLLFVTASSDGAIRIWNLLPSELKGHGTKETPVQVGGLIGTLETANRITCLGAFVMDGKVRAQADGEAFVGAEEDGEDKSEESSEDEDDDSE